MQTIDFISKTASETSNHKRVLLIVDDDEGPRKSLALIFENEYRVLTADNGLDALELIKQFPVDTAILDIRMYGMSGIELLENIKKADPTIEAIMLTGYESIDTIRQALRFGACDYLSKPFDVKTIRAAVGNAMNRRSLSEEIRATHRKIADLHTELKQQSVREEIARNKGEIYASILHDINGPLTIIAGYIQLMDQDLTGVRRVEGEEIETVRSHICLINRQVTHCVEISQRYLGFLRRKPSDRNATSVNKTLEDIQSLLRGHSSRRGNQLQISELQGDASVLINGADLIQIILNLAINGFQSTAQPHTVKISAERAPTPVEIVSGITDKILFPENFQKHAAFVKISVEDDGPGIAAANLEKVFEPFFTTKTESGTGLGLSIVQRLIKESGSVLHLHSESGKGTVFNLYFPA